MRRPSPASARIAGSPLARQAGLTRYEAVGCRAQAPEGMEHWLPFFHRDAAGELLDYLPEASVVLDDRVTFRRGWPAGKASRTVDARHEAMGAGRIDPTVTWPVPAGGSVSGRCRLKTVVAGIVVQLSPLPQSPGPGVLDAGARAGQFRTRAAAKKINLFGALAGTCSSFGEDGQVVIASWSEGARERLKGLLADNGPDRSRNRRFRAMPEGKGGLFLVVWPLEAGFVAPGLAVIPEQDVLGERRPSRAASARPTTSCAKSIRCRPAIWWVHVEHGVGRYLRIETITALGAPRLCHAGICRECKLYLPVENIELLSRYGHGKASLTGWAAGPRQAKAKLKERIRRSPTG